MAKHSDIAKVETGALQPLEQIENLIHVIRGKQVMLDRDLARLYGVETFRLNEQVKRNIERFPDDFMFQLSKEEFENWKSQIAMTSAKRRPLSALPYAFTENGVAMLSSVLRTPLAISTNVQIMRAFTASPRLLSRVYLRSVRKSFGFSLKCTRKSSCMAFGNWCIAMEPSIAPGFLVSVAI